MTTYSDFDKTELYRSFQKIETYLGYLKGNELAYDYLERARTEMERPAQGGESVFVIQLDGEYQFPCPDHRFAVSPDSSVRQFAVTAYVEHGDPDPQGPVVQQIQSYADEAWHDGASWASGIAGYLFSLCERFAEPDVNVFGKAIEDLQDQVFDPIDGGAKTDWAEIGASLSNWSGESADGFKTFYTNYAFYKGAWANFVGYAVTGLVVATRIMDQTQRGSAKYAETMIDALEDQLTNWTRWQRPPGEWPRTPVWVADVAQIAGDAYGLLDHIPFAKDVKAIAEEGITVAEKVKTLAVHLGADITEHHEKHVKARKADEMYADVTATLADDYAKAYWDGMQRLQSNPGILAKRGREFSGQRVLDKLHRLQNNEDWTPETVGRGSAYDPQDDHQY